MNRHIIECAKCNGKLDVSNCYPGQKIKCGKCENITIITNYCTEQKNHYVGFWTCPKCDRLIENTAIMCMWCNCENPNPKPLSPIDKFFASAPQTSSNSVVPEQGKNVKWRHKSIWAVIGFFFAYWFIGMSVAAAIDKQSSQQGMGAGFLYFLTNVLLIIAAVTGRKDWALWKRIVLIIGGNILSSFFSAIILHFTTPQMFNGDFSAAMRATTFLGTLPILYLGVRRSTIFMEKE